MTDPLNTVPPQVPPSTPEESSRTSQIVKWAAIIVVLAGIGAVIGWFVLARKAQPTIVDSDDNSTTTQQVPQIIPGAVVDNDQDLDGLDDTKEKEYGTSDFEFDTDGDGLRDIDEIEVWKTDPTKPDSDGDGFADGFEVLKGYNPAGTGTL